MKATSTAPLEQFVDLGVRLGLDELQFDAPLPADVGRELPAEGDGVPWGRSWPQRPCGVSGVLRRGLWLGDLHGFGKVHGLGVAAVAAQGGQQGGRGGMTRTTWRQQLLCEVLRTSSANEKRPNPCLPAMAFRHFGRQESNDAARNGRIPHGFRAGQTYAWRLSGIPSTNARTSSRTRRYTSRMACWSVSSAARRGGSSKPL